jgi:hypothetical protein
LICYEFYGRYGLWELDSKDKSKISALEQNLLKKYASEIFRRLQKNPALYNQPK